MDKRVREISRFLLHHLSCFPSPSASVHAKVCTIPTFTDLTGSQLGIAIVRIGSSESLESSVTCMRVCVSILVCMILMINFKMSHDTMIEQNSSMQCNLWQPNHTMCRYPEYVSIWATHFMIIYQPIPMPTLNIHIQALHYTHMSRT